MDYDSILPFEIKVNLKIFAPVFGHSLFTVCPVFTKTAHKTANKLVSLFCMLSFIYLDCSIFCYSAYHFVLLISIQGKQRITNKGSKRVYKFSLMDDLFREVLLWNFNGYGNLTPAPYKLNRKSCLADMLLNSSKSANGYFLGC